MDAPPRSRIRIRVEGIVQGVGFRPFVHELAGRYGLAGFVGNDGDGVFAEAEGEACALDAFVADLELRAPPLALVERVTTCPAEPAGETGFQIVPSIPLPGRSTLVSPDMAPCADCLGDLTDPDDRRFGYPFTNCTHCGPRFTITTDVPYDRHNTTMSGFALCAGCEREYRDPADRRFHAQPVCCPGCGPSLRLLDADGAPVPGDPVANAAAWLRNGRILAVKGLGGHHLAVLAAHEDAVRLLRARKRREAKPFAVMAPDLAVAHTLAVLDETAVRLLTGPRRPIVLAPRRAAAPVAEAVAPGTGELGVMLPYTPQHHLLAVRLGEAFVLTSGNLADEPIVHRDDEALELLSGLADGFLTHDRPVHVRVDDSVVRAFRGRELPLRRSRGYVPAPLAVHRPFPRPVLACGAGLKNTFCLAKGVRAFPSQHIGDLESYGTLRAFTEGIVHFRRLFGIDPEVVAHDLHPEYPSTKYALDLADAEGLALTGVQHHHAHLAACLADNGADGPVIGVAFDGLGHGPDGTLWGGELLVADLASYRRAGHLEPVPMPGGTAAIRRPWRMAAAHLQAAYAGDPPELALSRRHADRWEAVTALARTGPNAPLTSSAGRLFDAVAAIAGIRDEVFYEGQAAIELERHADPHERAAYPAAVRDGDPLVISCADLVRCAAEDVRAGVSAATVSARFHNGLAAAVVRAAGVLRDRTGLTTAALSGGVFQNLTLLTLVVTGLEETGFRVLTHTRTPPNDGGISFGQAVVAAARDRSADAGQRIADE
ncbi:carbamoyltransferase HypF [Actinocorallia populi]|uniref:carbamoyltransferase HypF n=1 Tax=Actinocorallia populi TaxID=2079200 RepID=UPI0018E4E9B3|nr:carbamoyltransferase HypF [Actinocorallia populi]